MRPLEYKRRDRIAYLILAAYLAVMFVVNRYIKIELLFLAWLG